MNDIPDQSKKSAEIIFAGAVTREVVIAEVVYVLEGNYKYSHSEIAYKLERLLDLLVVENADIVRYALRIFGETSLDFVDCLLIGYNHLAGCEIFSFDKKLNNRLK